MQLVPYTGVRGHRFRHRLHPAGWLVHCYLRAVRADRRAGPQVDGAVVERRAGLHEAPPGPRVLGGGPKGGAVHCRVELCDDDA
jgi:hypothetical protein